MREHFYFFYLFFNPRLLHVIIACFLRLRFRVYIEKKNALHFLLKERVNIKNRSTLVQPLFVAKGVSRKQERIPKKVFSFPVVDITTVQ